MLEEGKSEYDWAPSTLDDLLSLLFLSSPPLLPSLLSIQEVPGSLELCLFHSVWNGP